MKRLRLASRGSKLALVQSQLVVDRLQRAHRGLEIEIVEIASAGDQDRTTPLAEGVGWFTGALQQALLRGEADIAVHSFKDLPTEGVEGLVVAAVPPREDARDALVSGGLVKLDKLRPRALVGTSSPRREAQLAALRPDLVLRPIRGNVDTRMAKVEAGEYDATVLALAGLRRLGAQSRAAQVFGFDQMLPAPAQGALAVECRADDADTRAIVEGIDDADSRVCSLAERAFVARLGAGCTFPAAAYAECHKGSRIWLRALIGPENRITRGEREGPRAAAGGLGRELADELSAAAGLARLR